MVSRELCHLVSEAIVLEIKSCELKLMFTENYITVYVMAMWKVNTLALKIDRETNGCPSRWKNADWIFEIY